MNPIFGILLWFLASVGAALPAEGQGSGAAKVGFLSLHSVEQESAMGTGASAFRAGMRALGYSTHVMQTATLRGCEFWPPNS